MKTSQKVIWTGRLLSTLAIAFLLFDAITKFFIEKLPPEALQAISSLQWPIEKMPAIGAILLICLVIHLIPKTAILGAVLLVGYLGGAVASHFRIGNPLFTHTLVPIYIAALLWVGLYLRDPRVRLLIRNRDDL